MGLGDEIEARGGGDAGTSLTTSNEKIVPQPPCARKGSLFSYFIHELNNVSVVEVEKDQPSLNKGRSISRKDAFIGMFYYDGNFKVDNNDKKPFQPQGIRRSHGMQKKMLETASGKYRDADNYSGSGSAPAARLPLFFKKMYFAAYGFSAGYRIFEDAGIEPFR